MGLLIALCASVACCAADALPHGGSLPAPSSPDPPRSAAAPWWHSRIALPLGIGPQAHRITADEAISQSLAQSPNVQRIRFAPLIQKTEISRQQAAFDWNNFLETNWANRSDPIGNTLTTGFENGRFEDDLLTAAAGLRKRSTSGAQWELAQRSGWQKNNSNFLVPNPQSTSRLELTVTQPLLEGRGSDVNYFRVVEAELSTQISHSDTLARLQDHVLQVATAYWELYQTRAAFLIRQHAATEADALVISLTERATLDATSRQILRARTAAAQRRAELMSNAAEADNAATRLRQLLGRTDYETELMPAQLPTDQAPRFDRQAAVQNALTGRPEVAAAVREVRAASLRLGVSRNQLLPRLDLIAGTYVAGLDANRNLLPAYGNQFVDGRPSVNVGLVWERPVGNRAARSAVQRRDWELQQSLAAYETALQTARAEVELALTRLDVTFRSLQQRRVSLHCASEELVYLQDRWKTAPAGDGPAILLLENLIDAQVRQADEATELAEAEADFNVAIVRFQRALGRLLRPQQHDSPPDSAELQSEMSLHMSPMEASP